MAVDTTNLKQHDGNYVVTYQNGIFELLKRTVTINKQRYIIAGLVPLYWNYFIQNNYLHKQFGPFRSIDKLYQLSNDKLMQ